jgi:hypothetical protein
VNDHVQLALGAQFGLKPAFHTGKSGEDLPHHFPGFGQNMPQRSGSVQNTSLANAGLLPNLALSTTVVQSMPPTGLPEAPVDVGEIVRNATQGATESVMNGMMKIMGSVLNAAAGSSSNKAANVRISDRYAIDTPGPASRAALTEGEEQALEDEQMKDAGSLVPTRLLMFPTRRPLMPPVDTASTETAGRVTSISEDIDSDIPEFTGQSTIMVEPASSAALLDVQVTLPTALSSFGNASSTVNAAPASTVPAIGGSADTVIQGAPLLSAADAREQEMSSFEDLCGN